MGMKEEIEGTAEGCLSVILGGIGLLFVLFIALMGLVALLTGH